MANKNVSNLQNNVSPYKVCTNGGGKCGNKSFFFACISIQTHDHIRRCMVEGVYVNFPL